MARSQKKKILSCEDYMKMGVFKTDGQFFHKIYEVYRSGLITVEFKTL
jgi:hypothetical protein